MKRTLFWVTLFSIAMGFLESAVVIYLRELYYPHGFTFPLIPMPNKISVVEIWREAATVVMLLAVGILAGRNKAERLAWFIIAFATWDIFYYIFLYVFVGWPQSLFTWDILFLIPVPWVGPVITPVIIALTMILYGLSVVYYSSRGKKVALRWRESLLLVAGSIVAIYAFTRDYMQQKGDILYRNVRNGGSMFTDLANYVPSHFNWSIFLAGEIMILLACLVYIRRVKAL